MTPADYIRAARVPGSVKIGTYGLWTIHRAYVPPENPSRARVGFPILTSLHRMTTSSLHTQFGEVVMEDSQEELRKHLPIWMRGRGRILISGLGLGCVVRGLLANPQVEHIDVVEIDATICRVVGEAFLNEPRVRILNGDARNWPWAKNVRWDFAWHDCHVDDSGNGLELHKLHVELLQRFDSHVRHQQGAWALPRVAKRLWPGLIG